MHHSTLNRSHNLGSESPRGRGRRTVSAIVVACLAGLWAMDGRVGVVAGDLPGPRAPGTDLSDNTWRYAGPKATKRVIPLLEYKADSKTVEVQRGEPAYRAFSSP